MRTLVCVMFLTTLFSSPGRCEFVMSVLEQPVSATAVMRGRVYGSTTDPRPNPCYGRSICEFTAALVKESDFNNSMRPAKLWGNGTFDTPKPAYFYPTIGEWWAAVYNKDVLIGTVLGTDGKSGYPACFALGASDKGSESAQPAVYISNCARVYPQIWAQACKILPAQININIKAVEGAGDVESEGVNMTVTCDQDVSLHVSITTGEKISLGGGADTFAILDWGMGYGKKYSGSVTAGIPGTIMLRAKTAGLQNQPAGVISGSAVAILYYD